MARQKRSKLTQTPASTNYPAPSIAPSSPSDPANHLLVSGSKLRRMIGISAVTLWRWRRDKRVKFPAAKSINGRLYFQWHEVHAWLAKQRDAA